MTSSLGKMTVSCNADISALKSKAKGIANSEYYCALIFSMALCVCGSSKKLVQRGGCTLGKDSCIPWCSSQSTTLIAVPISQSFLIHLTWLVRL